MVQYNFDSNIPSLPGGTPKGPCHFIQRYNFFRGVKLTWGGGVKGGDIFQPPNIKLEGCKKGERKKDKIDTHYTDVSL